MAERLVMIEQQARNRVWYWEALTILALGFSAGFLVGWAMAVTDAHAGGPGVLTWSQPADCAQITHWELLAAPITAAQSNPQPTNATIQATVTNGPPVLCGPSATRTTIVSGLGPMRFWLRAAAGLVKSGESNAVDVVLSLARPVALALTVSAVPTPGATP